MHAKGFSNCSESKAALRWTHAAAPPFGVRYRTIVEVRKSPQKGGGVAADNSESVTKRKIKKHGGKENLIQNPKN